MLRKTIFSLILLTISATVMAQENKIQRTWQRKDTNPFYNFAGANPYTGKTTMPDGATVMGVDGSVEPHNKDGVTYCVLELKVVAVVDENNLLATVEYDTNDNREVLFWFSGVKTDGVVDEQIIKPWKERYHIIGTRKYEAALGITKTVMVLSPIKSAEVVAGANDDTKPPKATTSAPPPQKQRIIRTWKWTRDDGKKQRAEGQFHTIMNGTLEILIACPKTEDGVMTLLRATHMNPTQEQLSDLLARTRKIQALNEPVYAWPIEVPMERLSEESRQFPEVKPWINNHPPKINADEAKKE